jgi:3-oxoacyl-[acyl-carrier-protein] synthase III
MKITNNFLMLPPDKLDVQEIMMDAGNSLEEAKKTIEVTGISSLFYANKKSLTEFIFSGLSIIEERHDKLLSSVDAVIVVSQSYDQRIPSLSTRIQKKFNMRTDAFCIDIMDGCSGYIKALSLASMLEKEGFKKILTVTGDLNSLITSQAELGTKILFGDGISISILEADASILDTRIFNNGDNKNIISCAFSDNILNMNGFEVFRFTRNVVPTMIKSYLSDSGQEISNYDLIALHQASKLVVSTICATLKFRNSLCDDFCCGEIGNLGSGSIGAWLSQIENLNQKGELRMLAVGYGSGLSWGLASVVVNVQRNEVIYV